MRGMELDVEYAMKFCFGGLVSEEAMVALCLSGH